MGVQFSMARQICTAKSVELAAANALKPADPLALADMVRTRGADAGGLAGG